MSKSTLQMITTLDYGALSPGFPSDLLTANPESLSVIQKIVLGALKLRCLVMDQSVDFNLTTFAFGHAMGRNMCGKAKIELRLSCTPPQRPDPALAVLSLIRYPKEIPSDLFSGPLLQELIYLDVSCITAENRKFLEDAGALCHQRFPNLRVLKLARIGWNTQKIARAILFDPRPLPLQFWSLDVSYNKLDDSFLDILKDGGVCRDQDKKLQHDAYFEVEGKLTTSEIDGVYFVKESNWSGMFSHPLRYLVDPPSYSKEQDADDHDRNREQRERAPRLCGSEPIRGDTVQDAITVMAGGTFEPSPFIAEWPARSPPRGPLTHIHLNGTDVTLIGVQSMLESNCGYIEHFECDRARILASTRERYELRARTSWLPSEAVLYGVAGCAYLFRPVISSNLRVLKTHHSLVTNTPTIHTPPSSMFSQETSVLENTWIAEKFFTASMDLAYPQRYVPDMNPRLQSLTLAKIPHYSTGIVVGRIIDFLKELATQEQAIERAKKLFPRHRGPPFLRGLWHVHLEFDTDAREEMASLTEDDDIDQAITEFNLTTDMWDSSATSSEPLRKHQARTEALRDTAPASSSAKQYEGPADVLGKHSGRLGEAKGSRLTAFPFSRTRSEYYNEPHHKLRVWIGNGVLGPSNTPAVNAYMINLTDQTEGEVAPLMVATPCHVAAGAPAGSYLFRDAWNRISIPREKIKRPTRAELLAGLRDVQAEIKAFRLASREVYERLVREGRLTGEVGQHEYFRGRVEMSR